MKKKIIVFISFFAFISLFVLYIVNFPLQKIKAEKAFSKIQQSLIIKLTN